jgi:hypothetical protein
MISSPKGIEGLGALGCMLVSSTSAFGGVEPFPVGVEPEVWPEGLLSRVSDGEVLEDMVGLCLYKRGKGVQGSRRGSRSRWRFCFVIGDLSKGTSCILTQSTQNKLEAVEQEKPPREGFAVDWKGWNWSFLGVGETLKRR